MWKQPNPKPLTPPKARRDTNCRRIAIGLLVVVVLLLLGSSILRFSHVPTLGDILNNPQPGNQPKGSTPLTTIGVTVEPDGEPIGISDGSYVLDTSRSDNALKVQAANALKKKDSASAETFWEQAITQQSNDVEAMIYLEDQHALSSGSPYVTLVVGTMLSGNNTLLNLGRDNLQGAYLAQKEFNDGDKIHGGVQVRLLIANTGSQNAYVTQVAQQVVNLAKVDHTFVGVMGWPYSRSAINAVHVLGQAHIPMVSQTASSDELTNISPYFFRVSPTNQAEAIAGAHYAEQTLHVKKAALFSDPNDAYSQSLATDFANHFQADGNQIVDREPYTVGKDGTLPTSLNKALASGADFIYFSGYADDMSTLLVDLPPGNMPVLGGDALYELSGYSSSARVNLSRLHFTAFAYPDEWGVLGLSNQQPAFFSDYATTYDPQGRHQGSPYGYTRADNDTILSYDAMTALLKGCDSALSSGKKTITPDDLRQALATMNGVNAFQGVSGQIAFGQNGDPVNKAIIILYVDTEGRIHMSPTVEDCFSLGKC